MEEASLALYRSLGMLEVCSASPGGHDTGGTSICDTDVPGMGHSVPVQRGEMMDVRQY